MTGARVYPYAIVPAGTTLPVALAGLRRTPVTNVVAGPLGAWASRLAPFQAGERDLLAHHRVVEVACSCGPALPVRFGTAFADEPALAEVLREREAALVAALARAGSKRELAVTLEWLVAPAQPAEPAAPVPEPGAGPGRAYLAGRARKWAAAGRRRARAESLAERVQSACARAGVAAGDVQHRIVPSPRIALSCAVLTDPARADDVLRCVREAAAGWDDVRLHLGGPWPPYSFSGAE